MYLIDLQNIGKRFSNVIALNDINISIPQKSIFGLLGPNGAGKTTLIRIITNILGPDTGKVLFDGELLKPNHTHDIGYMPEERGLYKKMKVGEQLLYLARLKGLSSKKAHQQIDYWIERFDIKDWWNKKVEDLSKGMQQKIQFISTIVHRPKLLILDEPFSGLDPINTNLIKDEIHKLRDEGTTIIFSTHRMEQVEEICDEIVLINKGENILQGNVYDIKQQFKKNKYSIKYEGDSREISAAFFEILEQKQEELIVKLQSGSKSNDLLQYFIEQEIPVVSFNEILPSINEIFINQVNSKQHE